MPFGLDTIPADVLVITIGLDVQRDRLEIVFPGYGRDDFIGLERCIVNCDIYDLVAETT